MKINPKTENIGEVDVTGLTDDDIRETKERWYAKYDQLNGNLSFEITETGGKKIMQVYLTNN